MARARSSSPFHADDLQSLEAHDHRRLGRELDLFSFSDEVGAGLPLWHPKGALVRSLLEDFWRLQHRARGYDFVATPHVGRAQLWETSGHLDFYRDSMYPPMAADGGGDDGHGDGHGEPEPYYVKPMNCPFHIEIYRSRRRSYRELPMRFAELGTVYRHERSGVRHGLLRVRGFTQDDAHIFCREDQLEDEIVAVVDFARDFLKAFGLDELGFRLATRPEKAVGSLAAWELAIATLRRALERAELPFVLDEGGGAFYGPKLDVHARDAHGRDWQLSTVQFDFNLPERFGLGYAQSDGSIQRPYVIHRALFGSLERFFGILVEHYVGAFPFWLAPVQARILPIASRHREYASVVVDRAKKAALRVELDDGDKPLAARIREGELEKIPELLVVGDRELAARQVSVRLRGGARTEVRSIEAWLDASMARSRGGPARGSPDGREREAAERARSRILERLETCSKSDVPIEYTFTMGDVWSRRVFVALLRRYGIKPYRYKRQRYTTVMARVPEKFLRETLWPAFQEISDTLRDYLSDVTERVVTQVLHENSSDADVVPDEQRQLELGSQTP